MKKIAGYFSVMLMVIGVAVLMGAGNAETFAEAMTIVGGTAVAEVALAGVVKWSETPNK